MSNFNEITFPLSFLTKNKQVKKSEKVKFMTNKEVKQGAFQEVFDNFIKDGILTSQFIIKTIIDAHSSLKKMYLLTLLDKNRSLFVDIKEELKKVKNGESFETASIKKDIVKKLRNYIETGDFEKKQFGEVTTPISLINDMLDTLPEDIWSNPNLKWLDPCAGVS